MRKGVIIMLICLLAFPIYTSAEQIHRVKSGETISLIAKQYQVSSGEVIKRNQYLINPNMLVPGQALVIPRSSYIVRAGDTLYKISKETGRSMAFIAESNNLSNWNNLSIGQILKIPNSYKVKPGDSLYTISKKLGIPIQFLAAENNLNNWSSLIVGQVLYLPENDDFVHLERLLTPIAQKHPNNFYFKGSSETPKVAITFDDGPHSVYTSEILDILKRNNAKATFFLLGSNIGGQQEKIRRIVAEGHTIGNHTWSHPDIRKLTSEQLVSEINQLDVTIEKITGRKPALFRPPYGFFNDQNLVQLSNNNYKLIKWSVDSFDWRDRDVDKILTNILPGIKQGSVILFHDTMVGADRTSATVRALPDLIRTLKSQGYQFVTVDELLGVEAYR